ncbi:MAG: hypothetical protein ABI977_16115 [Acidobacteriota bacterium]
MRTQNNRTQIRSGVTVRRRPIPSASSVPRRSRRKSEKRGQGARVIWLMMMIGGLIASGFLLAQRSQINAHQLRQAEEKFKTQLDDLSTQQRFWALEKERATNTQESERIARQSGLVQPQLKRTNQTSAPQPPSAKPAATVKQTAKAPAETMKHPAKSTVKPLVQPSKPSPKPTTVRASIKSSAPSSAKSGLAAKSNKIAPPGKANKDGKNQRQLAQNLPPGKKEKRR